MNLDDMDEYQELPEFHPLELVAGSDSSLMSDRQAALLAATITRHSVNPYDIGGMLVLADSYLEWLQKDVLDE